MSDENAVAAASPIIPLTQEELHFAREAFRIRVTACILVLPHVIPP